MIKVEKVERISMRALELLDRPPAFPGRVHSLFSSTCNIFYDGLGFISIQKSASIFSPLTLLLEGELPELRHVPIGKEAHFDPGSRVLRIGDVCFDLSGAETRSCRYIFPAEAAGCSPALLETMEQVCAIDAARDADMVSAAVDRKCAGQLEQLRAAAVSGDLRAMLCAAKGLIGLGRGLTPSGDDMLSGFLAVSGLSPRLRLYEEGLRAAILCHAEENTTPISYEFLRCAFEHQYAEPTAEVLNAVRADDTAACVRACRALLKMGSSSGRDCLRGMVAAAHLLEQADGPLQDAE